MTRPKVLIVADDCLTTISLETVLDLFGCEIVGTACRVSDALQQALQTPPEIAILDLHLAGERDGIEGAILLRQRLDVPVLLLTARDDAEIKARAALAQPLAFLPNPVSASRVISTVRNALEAVRIRGQLAPRSPGDIDERAGKAPFEGGLL